MRPNTIASLILLIFFFNGCDNKDIVSPVVDPGSITELVSISEPAWISLPADEESSLSEVFSVSKLVRADRQEFITLNRKYEGGKLGSVSIACVIVIPLGALNEDIYITMTIDDEKGCVTLQPEMKFNVPAKFTMILKGLDLENIDVYNVDFICFDKSNGIENIDSMRMRIHTVSGSIGVYEAAINLCSKYGITI